MLKLFDGLQYLDYDLEESLRNNISSIVYIEYTDAMHLAEWMLQDRMVNGGWTNLNTKKIYLETF